MATEIANLKRKIFEEDMKTGAAASEATQTKVGGNINKILDETCQSFHWIANGSYWITTVPDNAMDKEFLVPFNCEIVKMRTYNKTPGLSGTTECDIVKKQPGGGFATIFSTRPKIPFGSGVDAEIVQSFLPAPSTIFASIGTTIGVLASTNLNENDILRFNFVDKQSSPAEGFGLQIIVRCR